MYKVSFLTVFNGFLHGIRAPKAMYFDMKRTQRGHQ
jgi:hypothetical protein